jgi:hypothetical protein
MSMMIRNSRKSHRIQTKNHSMVQNASSKGIFPSPPAECRTEDTSGTIHCNRAVFGEMLAHDQSRLVRKDLKGAVSRDHAGT